MPFAIVAGYLQSNYGRDYANYLGIYDKIAGEGFGLLSEYELGFVLLMRACNALGLGYLFAIGLIVWVSFTFKLIFFKKYSPNFIASIFLYGATFFLLHDATQVRLSIATTFLLYASVKLAGENMRYFSLLCLVLRCFTIAR